MILEDYLDSAWALRPVESDPDQLESLSRENARLRRELRTLQTALAHANRLAKVGQLAASIAHEVNQPIGAARNDACAALRFLTRAPPDLAEARAALECVVNETYRAGDIIRCIRAQVTKAPPRMGAVDLNAAIEEVISLAAGELSKHRVSLQTELAEGLRPVHADRVQLQQVMLNLILNAIEAMSSIASGARQLSIRTEGDAGDGLRVTVSDSGPGVAAEDHERVFEPFYTTRPAGTGIGLSVCRAIVDAHSGRLWVEGAPSGGAAFRFTLPAQR